MKTVAIVAAHFPPSNLAGVHRARLLSQHLSEFGWKPVIITTHWRHYEEALDWELADLVDPDLEVIRTWAAPTKPVRVVGDIGIRALPFHLQALRKLARERSIDALLITVPSFYSALLGRMLQRTNPIPYGIDYIDPWVHHWPPAEIKCSKAWASLRIAERLEPWAVRDAALITGVAEGYYQGVLERNPHLKGRCVTAAMPYGFSTRDFQTRYVRDRTLSEFDPADGYFHLVYAGALLPKAIDVFERLLQGLALAPSLDKIGARLRLHFIGTGKSASNRAGFNVLPMAEQIGIADRVTEHPHRMGYVDVLSHLTQAHCVLVIGSTEPHYTPSKVYQAVQSRRPVLALLHEESTAVAVLKQSGAGEAITLSEARLPNPGEVAAALIRIANRSFDASQVDWRSFNAFSSRECARTMGEVLDLAVWRSRDKSTGWDSTD